MRVATCCHVELTICCDCFHFNSEFPRCWWADSEENIDDDAASPARPPKLFIPLPPFPLAFIPRPS